MNTTPGITYLTLNKNGGKIAVFDQDSMKGILFSENYVLAHTSNVSMPLFKSTYQYHLKYRKPIKLIHGRYVKATLNEISCEDDLTFSKDNDESIEDIQDSTNKLIKRSASDPNLGLSEMGHFKLGGRKKSVDNEITEIVEEQESESKKIKNAFVFIQCESESYLFEKTLDKAETMLVKEGSIVGLSKTLTVSSKKPSLQMSQIVMLIGPGNP